jgi:hypothetical protein
MILAATKKTHYQVIKKVAWARWRVKHIRQVFFFIYIFFAQIFLYHFTLVINLSNILFDT